MARTRKELLEELERLCKRVEKLETRHGGDYLVSRKVAAMHIFVGIVILASLLIQTVFTALGKPSPFSGGFGWSMVVYALIILIGYVSVIALLKNRTIKIQGQVSLSKAEINAAIKEAKETDDQPE